MLAIYTSHDSRWMDAKAWAKPRMIEVRERKERCYKGPDFSATQFYADDAQIVSDYSAMGVPRVTDDML